MMNRRFCLKLLSGVSVLALTGAAHAAPLEAVDLAVEAEPLWTAWKDAHLAPDGRVVDAFQQDGSHSEGQGYGMVLATEFDDPATFRRMFDWTELHLAKRGDGLLSWRWLPGRDDPVPDRNNASDGDLFYAWALVRATHKWAEARYMTRAIEIAKALADHCIVTNPANADRTLLLPAVHGFVHDDRVTVNPSYYMPLAMNEVAAATGVQRLAICAEDGKALLAELAGNALVPDWVEVNADGWRPSELISANAGYEALRVPLFLIWSGLSDHAAVGSIASVYAQTVLPGDPVPTVLEPLTGMVLERSPDHGYRALAGLVQCARSDKVNGAPIPSFAPNQPYYPATLHLFAMIAANKVLPECVPI